MADNILGELNPNARNPRTIDSKHLEMLKKSIEQFGDLSGFVYNRRSHMLISGHQRQKVMPGNSEIKILAKYDPPTSKGTVADGYVTVNGERFKYREVDWDEVQSKAATIAANKHGGEWEKSGLTNWLTDLQIAKFDMDLTGFTLPELPKLIMFGDANKEDVEDEVPEVKEPTLKLGDLIQLGDHTLLCGDATDLNMIKVLMNGEKVDMVFTDPPYGMSAVSKSGVLSANKNYRGDIMNDDSPDVAKKTYALVAGLGIPKLVFWGANYYSSALPDSTCWLVWDKNNGGSDQMDCELAWTNLKGVTRKFTKASEKTNRVHPTQKPIELIQWALSRYEAGAVMDLFGGSGSTLIACEKTRRRCFMMELDPHYCDVIVTRYVKYTGNSKVKINGIDQEWSV